MKSGKEVNIGLVKDVNTKDTKRGGGDISLHHKNSCAKFLRLTQSKGEKNDSSFMKNVDKFITGCGVPS